MGNLIRISDLELKLGKAEIFSGFDLEVGRGEKVGIIGGEGSGKVTLKFLAKFIQSMEVFTQTSRTCVKRRCPRLRNSSGR